MHADDIRTMATSSKSVVQDTLINEALKCKTLCAQQASINSVRVRECTRMHISTSQVVGVKKIVESANTRMQTE